MSAQLAPKDRKGPALVPVAVPKTIIPMKLGWFGPEKSGKSTSAALLALALSVQFHDRAPVVVTDTEPGWQFLKRIFKIENVPLIQRTTPTFKSMLDDIAFAEREGACVYAVDTLTVIWAELMNSFKLKNNGFIPINVWGDIKQLWRQYALAFINSPMHCMALGRLGNIMEEIEEKPGQTKLVKTGTQLKAGGGESFGYEPHLLIEMSCERKAKKKQGVANEGEGRQIHRGDVLGDRSWALNGKIARWSDKASYEAGGYAAVWTFFKPHFNALQETGEMVLIASGENSTALITDSGQSAYYENRARRDVMVSEVTETLNLMWGGTAQDKKAMRVKAIELVFGFKSKEALERVNLSTVERGLKIMREFELKCREDRNLLLKGDDEVLEILGDVIVAFDAGEAPDVDLAF